MSKKELKVKEEDEFVKKLKEKLNKLNQNKEFVSFLSREKDIKFQMNTERSEGKIEIAKNMLIEKVDFNIICKTTGLTEQEVLTCKKYCEK